MVATTTLNEMYDFLYSIFDECGLITLSDGSRLRYESWSSICVPSDTDDEDVLSLHALSKSSTVLAEWQQELGLTSSEILCSGHEETAGNYGVTYMLFKRHSKNK